MSVHNSADSQPTPAVARLMEAAAEKRAAGYSWNKVAELVGRKLETVRKWQTRYPELWRQLLQAARDQHATDAAAEALSILRTQLRNQDDKLVQAAAKAIIQHFPPTRMTPAAHKLESYVDGLDEREKEQLEDALDAVDDA